MNSAPHQCPRREDEYDEDHAGETGRWILALPSHQRIASHNVWRGAAAELANPATSPSIRHLLVAHAARRASLRQYAHYS